MVSIAGWFNLAEVWPWPWGQGHGPGLDLVTCGLVNITANISSRPSCICAGSSISAYSTANSRTRLN